MKYKIKQIVEEYKNFIQDGSKYYKDEIIAKLEDAMVSQIKSKGTGIKIVHGGRSMVSYTGMKGIRCELADVRFLFYSPVNGTCRLVFLHFEKNRKYRRSGRIIEIKENHFELYHSHPDVYSKTKNVYIPEKILQDNKNGFDHSCTMYGIIDGESSKYSISFAGAEQLKYISGEKYEYPVSSVVEIKGNAGFEYCSYIPSLEEFFEQAKEMRIGREIEFKDLHIVLGDMCEMMPDELKILVPKSDNRDMNIENKKFQIVNTIFLNVDELE